jgi:hypothetical protein
MGMSVAKQNTWTAALSIAGLLAFAAPVQAQNESKVCFYAAPNYQGASYCAAPGLDTPDADQIRINGRAQSWNKRIQSIQLRGSAKVSVWEGKNYTGPSVNLSYSVPDLSRVNTTAHGVRNWSNSISSYKPHY